MSLREQYEEAFKMKDITSKPMEAAITEWYSLYYNQDKTEQEDPCQRIPFTIVKKLSKTTFSEYSVETKDEFIQSLMKSLDKKRKAAVQKALMVGVAWLKPVPIANTGIRFSVVPRNNVLIFAKDPDGMATDVGTAEITVSGSWYYTLLERRTVNDQGYLRIQNSLYRAREKNQLGTWVPLGSLPMYEKLKPEYIFPQPIGNIGMIPLTVPMENCVDGSEDPCSVYAACVGLIHNINQNEAQMNGEFERAESRILAPADMLEPVQPTRVNGELDTYRYNNRKKLQSHVFTAIEGDGDQGVTIFSPEIRQASFLERKTEYLRNCESLIGLQRGLLSDVQDQAKTATEITDSKGDYALTIQDMQEAWEETFGELMQLCAVLGKLYHIPGAHDISEDAYSIGWGNGILYDEAETWKDMKDQVARGLLRPTKAVGWKHGMPTDTQAQEEKVRKTWMPEKIEELVD